jgi:DNA-binding NtrC family response regulator
MNRELIVNDDESILFALRRLVTRRGWEPLAARSGSEALKFVDRADVVVTDLCNMPFMSGLELIQAIRQRDEMLPGA